MTTQLLLAFAVGFIIAIVASKVIRIVVSILIVMGLVLLGYMRFFT